MDEPLLVPVEYASPTQQPPGLFAGRFVTFATVNFVISGAGLLIAVPALLFYLLLCLADVLGTNGQQITPPSVGLLAALAVAVVSSTLVLVGSAGSFWRRWWARRCLQGGLAGELLVDAVAAADAWSHGWPMQAVAIGIGTHATYTVIALYCYSDRTSGSYFDPDPPRPAASVNGAAL